MLTIRRQLAGMLVLCVLAAPGRAADADKYLPSSTEGVITVNIKQMLTAPLVKNNIDTLKGLLLGAGNTQQILNDMGVDPFQHVDSIVVGVDRDPAQSLAVINGTFDVVKIRGHIEKAVANNSKIVKIAKTVDHTYYEVKPPEQDETMYVAVLDGATVAASPSKTALLDALDKKAGKKKAELKKELVAMLAKADKSQSISLVALGGALAATGQPAAAKITTLSGGITLADDVKAQFLLNTANANDAKAVEAELKEGIDQIKALVELTVNNNKELQPLMDVVGTLKVAASGATVSVSGQISRTVINTLVPKQ